MHWWSENKDGDFVGHTCYARPAAHDASTVWSEGRKFWAPRAFCKVEAPQPVTDVVGMWLLPYVAQQRAPCLAAKHAL
eukprot:7385538-Prymnesium_polylepis.1